MTKKPDQIAFALEILKLLADQPYTREQLGERLSEFLEKQNTYCEDVLQKITRTIRKLRECGFTIKSASHHPYELLESNFPIILSIEQRQSLYMAAHFLADMGFSAQAGQIARLYQLSQVQEPPHLKVNFSPPVDYSEAHIPTIVEQLQVRFNRQYRYTIRYQNSFGNEKNWDLDYSELRLNNGVLYLFAYIPDAESRHLEKKPNLEQNFLFRLDRIKRVGAVSEIRWFLSEFPSLNIRYRMSGALANYQPRRNHELVIKRNLKAGYVDIETREDYLFWFRQRVLQYGANVQVLEPYWLAQEIWEEHQKAYLKYSFGEK